MLGLTFKFGNKEKTEPEDTRSTFLKGVEDRKRNIPFEITKIKGGNRIVIKRGRIRKDAKWIYWPKMKTLYHNNLSELHEYGEQNNKRDKLVFDVDYCEPFETSGKIERSTIVEKALINQSMDDFSDVVALTGFELTRKHLILMAGVFAIILPVGLSIPSIFPSIAPNVVTHWFSFLPHS